jgi:hypothetical protein
MSQAILQQDCIALVMEPRGVAALRVRERRLHLPESVDEIDQQVRQCFREHVNLCWRRVNRAALTLAKASA